MSVVMGAGRSDRGSSEESENSREDSENGGGGLHVVSGFSSSSSESSGGPLTGPEDLEAPFPADAPHDAILAGEVLE